MGKYASDLKLAFSQSTLMFQVILFSCYILAAAVYARNEDWNCLEGVYYITVAYSPSDFGTFPQRLILNEGYFPQWLSKAFYLLVSSLHRSV